MCFHLEGSDRSSCNRQTMKHLTLFSLVALVSSCEIFSDDGLICTEEYRTIGIEVTGGTLEDHYTVRVSNGDTIRFASEFVFDNWYPVLADDYQEKLEGRTETFRFEGWIAEQIVVQEDFRIRADQCHIELVSGNTEVTISAD